MCRTRTGLWAFLLVLAMAAPVPAQEPAARPPGEQDRGTLLVAGGEPNALVVVDWEAAAVVRTFSVGTEVRGCALLPDGRAAYLALPFEDELWRLNLDTGEVEALISTGVQGHSSVAVVGDTAYAASAREPLLVQLDVSTDRVTRFIPLAAPVHMLRPDPTGRFLYVSFVQGQRVGVLDLDTGTLVREIPVGRAPYGLEISRDGRWLYVALRGEDRILVLDLETLQEVASFYVNVTRGGLGDLRLLPSGALAVGETYGRTLWLLDPLSGETRKRLVLATPIHQMALLPEAEGLP